MIALDAANSGRATLTGPVTFANVNAVLDEGTRAFKAACLTVDLAGVTEVDSTAVSVLLEWRRAAARDKRAIDYVNLPANLKSLIQLYGVAELIGV
ncbi:MAG: STAS domain-containing protein [Betaproteobacteria bacterium]|nr:STAS domain-containing protein [Betaproteobacteria bacterium]